MTDQELEALYVAVARERNRRESRESATKALVEAVATIRPALEAYAEAYSVGDADLAAGICDALTQVREAGKPDEAALAPSALGWAQPMGAHDAYQTGDIVIFQGKKWRSSQDGNVWSPAAYPQGWEEVND